MPVVRYAIGAWLYHLGLVRRVREFAAARPIWQSVPMGNDQESSRSSKITESDSQLEMVLIEIWKQGEYLRKSIDSYVSERIKDWQAERDQKKRNEGFSCNR